MKMRLLIFICLFNSFSFSQSWPPSTRTDISIDNVTLIECLTIKFDKFKAKQLISSGCDLNVVGLNGESVIELAVKGNMYDVVQILLEKNVDVNSVNVSGTTPIMFAVERANFKMIKLLIEFGADIYIKDYQKKDVLSYALGQAKERIKVIQMLIENGYDLRKFTSVYGESIVSFACRTSDLDLLRFVVEEKGFNVDEVDTSGLDLIEKNYFTSPDLFKFLVEKISNKKLPNYYFKAVRMSNNDLVDYLLNCYEIDVNSLNVFGETTVMSDDCSIKLMTLLIKKGIDVNIKSPTGMTAIMNACKNLNLEKVILLHNSKANINLFDENNWTALDFAERSHLANENKRKECIILFLKNYCKAENGKNIKEIDFLRN